jgi:hypothetical protein
MAEGWNGAEGPPVDSGRDDSYLSKSGQKRLNVSLKLIHVFV